MSKRKIVAGGYEESSDVSDIDGRVDTEQALKRSKSAPYAPPRLTSGSFLLPRSVSSSIRGSVPPRQVSLSRSTPEIMMVQDRVDTRGSTPAEGLSSAPKGPNGPPKLQSDAKLDRILEAVNCLAPANGLVPQVLGHPVLAASAPSEAAKQYTSNPSPTPELIDIVSKVVSEARGRIGKKKGGTDDNSCKEHARNTFYRMLGINAAREIRPFFEDEYGEPDTLPVQFLDADTGYCRPFPHWKAPLTKQVAWIPTFILRFKSTIPNDRSELSNVLWNLSDEQIIILLNDGPFKSAQAAWRDLKKTNAEIEVMRSNARRYQRSDRKATIRASYIRVIPSLQGSEWEYLSQIGYMSQDESDVEVGMVTKRPKHWAKWDTNLFDAIHAAERKKAMAKPGHSPHIPPRQIKVVKRPVPQLERGTGSSKVVIRIAFCGISKSWREKNPEEFWKCAHLINARVIAKPDIDAFLVENPMVKTEVEEGSENQDSMDAEHAGDNGAGQDGGWKSDAYEEEESGLILDILERQGSSAAFGMRATTGEQGVLGSADGFDIRKNSDVPIDPRLLGEDMHNDKMERGGVGSQSGATASGVSSEAHRVAPVKVVPMSDDPNPGQSVTANHAYNPLPSGTHEMPPPPPLDHNSAPAAGQLAANSSAPAGGAQEARATSWLEE
ncbi:hypothetical protein FS749_004476 [Ceratobasidium sp. UAMH 11750]|nr:hypothetical protein FS749_004476 [Ceratobasidium sp. UAMH 11750]